MSLLTTMAALFALVIVGFISHRLGLMGGDFDRKLSTFVIQVTCPALILASTMGETLPDARHIPVLLGVSLLTYVILITLAYILPRFLPIQQDLRGMYSFMLTYSNVAFLGYPVVASIFGPEAVFYACILNIVNTITVFIWGIMFITGDSLRQGFNWKLLISPSMIATYISILIVLLRWQAPEALARPMSILGQMTVPASLLIIGSSIAGLPARKMIGTPSIFIMCALKLIILPWAIYQLLLLMHVQQQVAAINIMLIAMPVASYGTMFCLRYGKDETTISQGTFWSTLLSIGTIPLLVSLL